MLDIGWTELLVIAIVLIVVVGPKDLPPMLRAFGKMTANLRRMAGDFRTQFDEALRESELDEVRKTIADAQSLNPASNLRDALNPLRQMGEDIKSDLRKVTAPPVTPAVETPKPDAAEETPPVAAPLPVPAPENPPPAPLASVPPEPAPAAGPAPVVAKAPRKPRAAASGEKPAPRPRKTAAKAEGAEGSPVKKAAPRRKKTTETGKDEA